MVAVSVQMWRCTFVVIICCVASALLRFYAAYVGSTLPTSRDNLYVQSSRTKQSRNIPAQLLVNKFQHTWRKSEDVLHHDGSLKSRQSFHMFRATEERRGHQTRYYGWQINAKCSLCLKQWIRLGLLGRGAEGVLLFGRVMLWCSLLHLVWIQTVIIHDFWPTVGSICRACFVDVLCKLSCTFSEKARLTIYSHIPEGIIVVRNYVVLYTLQLSHF